MCEQEVATNKILRNASVKILIKLYLQKKASHILNQTKHMSCHEGIWNCVQDKLTAVLF